MCTQVNYSSIIEWHLISHSHKKCWDLYYLDLEEFFHKILLCERGQTPLFIFPTLYSQAALSYQKLNPNPFWQEFTILLSRTSNSTICISTTLSTKMLSACCPPATKVHNWYTDYLSVILMGERHVLNMFVLQAVDFVAALPHSLDFAPTLYIKIFTPTFFFFVTDFANFKAPPWRVLYIQV